MLNEVPNKNCEKWYLLAGYLLILIKSNVKQQMKELVTACFEFL